MNNWLVIVTVRTPDSIVCPSLLTFLVSHLTSLVEHVLSHSPFSEIFISGDITVHHCLWFSSPYTNYPGAQDFIFLLSMSWNSSQVGKKLKLTRMVQLLAQHYSSAAVLSYHPLYALLSSLILAALLSLTINMQIILLCSTPLSLTTIHLWNPFPNQRNTYPTLPIGPFGAV